MNKISVSKRDKNDVDASTFNLTYENANKMMPVLRSDHFREVILSDVSEVEVKMLKFLIQLSRLLKSDGSVTILNGPNQQLQSLLTKLGLNKGEKDGDKLNFTKKKPQEKIQQKSRKLAIGFKSNQDEEYIDEDELLKGQNISLNKKKQQNCVTKPRACANCNCGRKNAQEQNITKQDLVKSVNQGQPISGCGKCQLGDSFRCGSCPYKGLPAFKPGDKLKLMQQGGVIVEEGAGIIKTNGKVKLEL